MLGNTPSYLPKTDATRYRILSFGCYVLFLVVLLYGALSFLFPYQRYSFDFTNPDATKNNLFEPHLSDFTPLDKGKLPALTSLVLYANNPQVLQSGDVTVIPQDPSLASALQGSAVTVRRGFAATFFPHEDTLDVPTQKIVEYGGNYYEWREAGLYPFVSQAAAESHVPKDHIGSLSGDVFSTLSVQNEILGFRPGTMLAYADGVFFVTEDATIRPFGSAEVLLRAGYTFDHILPASGEDVGIYKRGKIILPGELHPGGTLFFDTDTRTTLLFQNKTLRPLTPAYADFLKTKNDVIAFSSQKQEQESSCLLTKTFLRNAFTCQFNALSLQEGARGNDYQITLAPIAQAIDIDSMVVGLQSSRQNENAKATIRSLANRVLERIGLY